VKRLHSKEAFLSEPLAAGVKCCNVKRLYSKEAFISEPFAAGVKCCNVKRFYSKAAFVLAIASHSQQVSSSSRSLQMCMRAIRFGFRCAADWCEWAHFCQHGGEQWV
jgi:hypothetical protein